MNNAGGLMGVEEAAVPEPPREARLLPWSGAEGKPCFLIGDEQGGPVTCLADATESIQLGMGAEAAAAELSRQALGIWQFCLIWSSGTPRFTACRRDGTAKRHLRARFASRTRPPAQGRGELREQPKTTVTDKRTPATP
ncbi:hypothetical protein [Streptomyces capitiformicae]|uniref:Uncharacterized protein n=1 Tax=Streptomyces capitiformicae TaxID=2014920 RepID=A0A918ZA35_9ACTN|nr:hypothetical protein [Streptomyces capitiformicae]GHE40432.1 hypothetical protein GCM10017771_59560 [Streptomyces capitiformicae]